MKIQEYYKHINQKQNSKKRRLLKQLSKRSLENSSLTDCKTNGTAQNKSRNHKKTDMTEKIKTAGVQKMKQKPRSSLNINPFVKLAPSQINLVNIKSIFSRDMDTNILITNEDAIRKISQNRVVRIKSEDSNHTGSSNEFIPSILSKRYSFIKPDSDMMKKKHRSASHLQQCKICYKSFLDSKQLDEHKQLHIQKRAFSVSPTLNKNIIKSVITNFPSKPFEKNLKKLIDKPRPSKNTLLNFDNLMVKPRLKCCGQLFAGLAQFYIHLDRKTAKPRTTKCHPVYVCYLCQNEFKKLAEWFHHNQQVHKISLLNRKSYSCIGCCAEFGFVAHLEKHMIVCRARNSELWNFRNEAKRFTQTKLLGNADDNVGTKKKTDQKKTYTCDICYDQFTEITKLLKHLAFHQEILVANMKSFK